MFHLRNRLLALCAPAVIVAAAVALPSIASAHVVNPAHWTINEERLEGEATLAVEGELTLEGGGGEVSCAVAGTDVIFNEEVGGTSAQDEVTEFEILTPTCVTGQALAGCTVVDTNTTASAENPWLTAGYFDESERARVEIDGIEFKDVFDAGCLLPETTAFGSLDAFVVNPGAITAIQFKGAESGTLETKEQAIGRVTITGEVAVAPAGVYDLEPGF